MVSTEYGTPITDIMSYVIPDSSEDIYGCGYSHLRPGQFESDYSPGFRAEDAVDPNGYMGSSAAFFGMRPNGDLKFVFNLGILDGIDIQEYYA